MVWDRCAPLEFRTLQLADKNELEALLKPLKRNDSALSFANLYSLSEKYGTQICLEEGMLYVRQLERVSQGIAYYPPLGAKNLVASVYDLRKRVRRAGEVAYLVGVISPEKQLLEEGFPDTFHFGNDRDFADYLYRRDTIAAYAGSALAKKRRETNKFFQLYGDKVIFEELTNERIDEVHAYQQRWFETNRQRGSEAHPLELEHRKIVLDLNHFDDLDLRGIAIRLEGVLQGYAYGALLPGGAFDVMVLKANLAYRFIWRALLRELARTSAKDARYLNLEEDLGLSGLRENKLSYQPLTLIKKYCTPFVNGFE